VDEDEIVESIVVDAFPQQFRIRFQWLNGVCCHTQGRNEQAQVTD